MKINNEFTGLTVIICATDETESLERTVKTFAEGFDKKDLSEIVIVYPDFVSDNCLNTARKLRDNYADVPVTLLPQTRRGLGAGARQAFAGVTSSHILLTDADWSHDYSVAPLMLESVKENPDIICKFSRRLKRGSFHDYGTMQYIANSLAQTFLRMLYGGRLSDITEGIQIAPSAVLKNIQWQEDGFAFLMELALRPMRMGCQYIEFPADCYGRKQGESHNSIFCKAGYLKQAIIIRLTPPCKIAPVLFDGR